MIHIYKNIYYIFDKFYNRNAVSIVTISVHLGENIALYCIKYGKFYHNLAETVIMHIIGWIEGVSGLPRGVLVPKLVSEEPLTGQP